MGDFLIDLIRAVFGVLFLVALWKIRHQIFTESGSPGPQTLAIAAAAILVAFGLYALALPVVAYARRDRHPS